MREVSEQPAGGRVVLLRQESDVVPNREQALEELASLRLSALEREVVGKPEGAGVTPTGDPKMDHSGDLPSQAQSGTKFLEDLANEKYTTEQLNAPGTYVYTIPMGASKDVLWANGWCATTGDILKQNLTQMKFTLTVNGKEVPESQVGSFEGNVGGQSCHYIWVLFTDWPIGEHVIVSTTTMLTKINDGTADYQPGDRVSEYHIIVNR